MNDTEFLLTTLLVISLIIVVLYIFICDKICNSKSSLEYFEFTAPNFNKNTDKTILMVGATHGNEPAGHYALKNLLNNLLNTKIKEGRLIIIPTVNYCAFQLGIRFIPFIGDLNRKYPTSLSNQTSSNKIISQIIDFVKEADFILDFHEGEDYNGRNSRSMGSTITPSNNDFSMELAIEIVKKLNENIYENYKKFKIYTSNEDLIKSDSFLYIIRKNIKGSLSYYSTILNKNYILVETTGKTSVEPLDDRISKDSDICEIVLKKYNII